MTYKFGCNFSIALCVYRTRQYGYFLRSINGAAADSFVGVREFERLSDVYVRMCVGARCPSFHGLYSSSSLMSCHDNTDCCVGGKILFLLKKKKKIPCQSNALKISARPFRRDWPTLRRRSLKKLSERLEVLCKVCLR